MATLIQVYKPGLAQELVSIKEAKPVKRNPPRTCMVISVGLILAGMGAVVLMALELLPVTFLIALAGLVMTATGGVMTLIFCGEI